MDNTLMILSIKQGPCQLYLSKPFIPCNTVKVLIYSVQRQLSLYQNCYTGMEKTLQICKAA